MTRTNKIALELSDKSNFEKAFRNFYSELCGFANTFMKDIEDSEEIVQEMFVNLWKNRLRIDIKTSFKAYLYSSVRNACMNKKKHIKIREEYKEHNEREIELNFANTEETVEADELQDRIRVAIEKLPKQQRKVFVLSRYEGKKYKEIAKELNISLKTVENHIGSALKFLRKELIDYIIIFFLFFLRL